MTLLDTGRKTLSDLLKGYGKFEGDSATSYYFENVDVEGSGDVEPIGTPLMWSETDSAFIEFAINADWVANTAYSVGAVVKPTTQDGYEYVCTVAGTSNDSEGEEFIAIPGATTVETDAVEWLCRPAYAGNGIDSPLPNAVHICVTVGTKEGVGFNKDDVTLSGTSVEMPVIYRGEANLSDDGFEWGSIATVDQNEFLAALKRNGIAISESSTDAAPVFLTV